jgi:Phosphotransferase enzyme family
VDDVEIPLVGGELTSVVRVGDTVRRPTGPQTPAVHALLRHLEARGFAGAPRVLGIDERGREVLTYVDGDCADSFLPPVQRDQGVEQIGRMLRAYHDAVTDFRPPAGAVWLQGPVPIADGQIVCHGDLGAWNTVWRGDTLAGFIDWDFAEPRRPLDDIAEVAWHLVPLGADRIWRDNGFISPPDRVARLRALCRGYGAVDPGAVVDALPAWQRFERDRTAAFAAAGMSPWSEILARPGECERVDDDIAWLAAHAAALRRDLA